MLFAQYMCCSPSMEVQIEETGNRNPMVMYELMRIRHNGFPSFFVADRRLIG